MTVREKRCLPTRVSAGTVSQQLEGAAELSFQELGQAWTDASFPEKPVYVGLIPHPQVSSGSTPSNRVCD